MKLVHHLFLSPFMPVLLGLVMTVLAHEAGGFSGPVKLPQPVLKGKTSIETALSERRSIREYGKLPLPLPDLSQILWACQGITGAGGLRSAPSAGALYPLEVYVVVGNVSGLEPGIYLYKPHNHELIKVSEGDKRSVLSRAALGQRAIASAAAILVISAVYERTTIKYGERGNRYVHMEAGHAAENIYLQAVSLNLGTVAIGAFDDDAVKRIANLTVREQPLYLMPIGKLHEKI